MCYGEAYQRSELKCKGTAERRNAKELLRKVLKLCAWLWQSQEMRSGAETWKGVAMQGKVKMRGGTESHRSAR